MHKNLIEKQIIVKYIELLRNQTKSKVTINTKLTDFVTYLN